MDVAHSNVDRLFTYEVPNGLAVTAGQRVLIPFGGNNRSIEGFVLELSENAPEEYRHYKACSPRYGAISCAYGGADRTCQMDKQKLPLPAC